MFCGYNVALYEDNFSQKICCESALRPGHDNTIDPRGIYAWPRSVRCDSVGDKALRRERSISAVAIRPVRIILRNAELRDMLSPDYIAQLEKWHEIYC